MSYPDETTIQWRSTVIPANAGIQLYNLLYCIKRIVLLDSGIRRNDGLLSHQNNIGGLPARIRVMMAVLLLALSSPGTQADDNRDNPVSAGIAAYENSNYKDAVENFKSAIQSAPDASFLHHWLGKCYGRIAEHGNWFKAISYSKKNPGTIPQGRRTGR